MAILGSHFGFECQDVSEHNKNHSITCVMPELTGNDTLFAFLSSLYQERSLFWFSLWRWQPLWATIVEFESQEPTQNPMNTILSDLQSQS